MHQFIYKNSRGIIASDFDYHLPLLGNEKYLGLIPNPINTEKLSFKPLQIIDKIEIIVVNDGSTDSTQEVAEQAGARVILHPYSKGNGAAIKTGARSAIGDIIVFMDADGQHDPNDIPRLINAIEQGYDLQ